jgi:hypothetical protein
MDSLLPNAAHAAILRFTSTGIFVKKLSYDKDRPTSRVLPDQD